MKEQNTNFFREEVFISENGMKIKRLTNSGSVLVEIEDDQETPDAKEFKDTMYEGVLQILTPVGPREISFEIESDSLENAFKEFPKIAKTVVEDLYNKMQERKNSSLVTASPEDLKKIERGSLF
jgi:hypothetical protein